jgi:hypothetical protein
VSDVVNVTTRTATKHNYRKVLQETTGKVGDGFEAHHTLPQKHRSEFEALDINIDEPGNVVWRKKKITESKIISILRNGTIISIIILKPIKRIFLNKEIS